MKPFASFVEKLFVACHVGCVKDDNIVFQSIDHHLKEPSLHIFLLCSPNFKLSNSF